MKHGAIVEMTETASRRARELAGAGGALRLDLRTSGCAGHSYVMEKTEAPLENDEVVESGGVKLCIAPGALLFLVGMRVDWREDRLSSGFVFENPNEVDACGCGESVMLKAATGVGG